MKVGLFIDTWYPMVDGVIKVVDNYARRLVQYCLMARRMQSCRTMLYDAHRCRSSQAITNFLRPL